MTTTATTDQTVPDMHSTNTMMDLCRMEAMSASENVKQLTKANLAELESMQQPDKHFEESHIRQEGMQLFDRAHCAFIHALKPLEDFESDVERIDAESLNGGCIERAAINVETSIESVARQYPARAPSSAQVLERFAFISPQTEPSNVHATIALKSYGIDEGSLEHVTLRAEASRIAAAFKTPPKSDSTKAVTSDASSDSDSDWLETLVVDSDHECEARNNGSDDLRVAPRFLAKGRDRKKRVLRVRRDADDIANKRRRA